MSKKINGNVVTVEELCRIIEEEKGYFDGDKFEVSKHIQSSSES